MMNARREHANFTHRDLRRELTLTMEVKGDSDKNYVVLKSWEAIPKTYTFTWCQLYGAEVLAMRQM